jgi:hypothetical protein
MNNREIGKIFEGIDMNLDIARFGLDKICLQEKAVVTTKMVLI